MSLCIKQEIQHVTPSQRINDLKHQLWILFNANGSVITGFCSFTAGHSKCCNHISAVLFKIEYANEKRLTNPACTDESCQWNSSAKEICPKKIEICNFCNIMKQSKRNVTENCANDRIDSFNSKLSSSDSQTHELEKATRNQSTSHNWWSQRKGRITASRFHEVNQKVQTIYKNRLKAVTCRTTPLLLSIVEPKALRNIESLEWGKKNEKNAS